MVPHIKCIQHLVNYKAWVTLRLDNVLDLEGENGCSLHIIYCVTSCYDLAGRDEGTKLEVLVDGWIWVIL